MKKKRVKRVNDGRLVLLFFKIFKESIHLHHSKNQIIILIGVLSQRPNSGVTNRPDLATCCLKSSIREPKSGEVRMEFIFQGLGVQISI